MADNSSLSFVESEDLLHEEARRAVGYDDFGDPAYLEGLRVVSRAYDREARFNPNGRLGARQGLLTTLEARLRSNRLLRENPAVLENRIERPIVICGLVRTGSTALHYLLGQDPDLQCLQYWLGGNPQPRPPREDLGGAPSLQGCQGGDRRDVRGRPIASRDSLHDARRARGVSPPVGADLHRRRARGERTRSLLLGVVSARRYDRDLSSPPGSRQADRVHRHRTHVAAQIPGSHAPHRCPSRGLPRRLHRADAPGSGRRAAFLSGVDLWLPLPLRGRDRPPGDLRRGSWNCGQPAPRSASRCASSASPSSSTTSTSGTS